MVLFGKEVQRTYAGKKFLELSLNSAIISLNDGFQGAITVFKF